MKYFMDTEFSEMGNRHPITLISIGIVAEDGREFYAIDDRWYAVIKPKASDWVKEHVLALLPKIEDISKDGGSPRMKNEWNRIMATSQIRDEIRWFIGDDIPEFWGYYADYDWVVFAQLFGAMIDLPKGWPMYCRDLKQVADEMGIKVLPEMPNKIEHHSLYDAREMKFRYSWLKNQL